MKTAVCTISTISHLHKVLALQESLRRHLPESELYCLICDQDNPDVPGLKGLNLLFPSALNADPIATHILQKYPAGSDFQRWALKPALLRYALRFSEKVIWCDNDLFFTGDAGFIPELLDTHSLLLSPHNRISDPETDPQWFRTNFKDGAFNAGFLAANREAEPALLWWEKATAHACEINFAEGLYVDQKYLDLMPSLFPFCGILHHPGCNVAYWNRNDSVRTLVKGELRIRGEWPLVFIHFTQDTIRCIEEGGDPLLTPFLDAYRRSLEHAAQRLK